MLWREQDRPTLRREADMMGLTACLALLAALMAGDDHEPHTRLDVLTIVWATTVGLALTHWFALTLSVRLVDDPAFVFSPLQVLLAGLSLASLVALISTVAVLVSSVDVDRLMARLSAAAFLGVLVGVELRRGGSSMRRAVSWGLGAIVVGLTLATAKWLIGR